MNSKGFNRRGFLKMASVGLAGGYVILKTGTSPDPGARRHRYDGRVANKLINFINESSHL